MCSKAPCSAAAIGCGSTSQLIDAATGNHLWAERFDKPVGDLFDMQDEIVARLARQLGTQLIGAEARRAERAPNPEFRGSLFPGHGVAEQGKHARLPARRRATISNAP